MSNVTKGVAADRSAIEPQARSIVRRRVPGALAEFLAVSITIGVATLLVLLFGMVTAAL